MGRSPIGPRHPPRAAFYVESFRLTPIAGGVRLQVVPGVFRGWIGLRDLVALGRRLALARGGRFEVQGGPVLRSVAGADIESAGAERVNSERPDRWAWIVR